MKKQKEEWKSVVSEIVPSQWTGKEIIKFISNIEQEAERRGYERGWANAEKNTAKVLEKLHKLLNK